MSGKRLLIVNADDLGLSPGVNAGIFEAHQRGIVTSTSLMVRAAAAAEAVASASGHPRLAVGLHLDIAEWQYEDGEWRVNYERCQPDDAAAVEAECREQLAAFRELSGRDPTHLDSHQHTHMSEPVASAAASLAAELEVPLRARGIRYEGGFYGQSGKGESYPAGIEAEHLVALIEALPSGRTELGCHPGIGNDTGSSYAAERELELRALCDPRVKAALEREEIKLCSFAQISSSPGR
ncbi:MAG TPA: ChbG/HpnK family deacetylase [Solirubrobacterales bacterium]|nr:ChbG/HpnK family deacetylase [Solirubrobacterales bacterium]